MANLNQIDKEIKIQQLEEEYGESRLDLAQQGLFDGICAGICVNPECRNIVNIEPDSDSGYCEECETNTVWSVLVLMGMM